MEKFLFLFSFPNYFNLIASHANSHTNTSTGLIANNNISNAIRGLMNNIIINNNIIICFSLILQQQQESNPRLPLVYTANYDYLILLFLTISSRYLIRYYLSIEQQGIEPHTVATCTSSNYSNSCLVQLHQVTAQQLSTSSMDYTPLTQQRESHPHLLFVELQYYYTMLCYYMP